MFWHILALAAAIKTFETRANGTSLICPVYFWEDDPVQRNNVDYEGGASRVSCYLPTNLIKLATRESTIPAQFPRSLIISILMKKERNWRIGGLLIWATLSCSGSTSSDQDIKTLDFTYNDTFSTAFSLKLNDASDTVYVKQDFTKGSGLPPGSYYAIIHDDVKRSLISQAESFLLLHPDNLYDEGLQDGEDYKICIVNSEINDCVSIHTLNPPQNAKLLSRHLKDLKDRLTYRKREREINFVSDDILPKPIKWDSVKFLPP